MKYIPSITTSIQKLQKVDELRCIAVAYDAISNDLIDILNPYFGPLSQFEVYLMNSSEP